MALNPGDGLNDQLLLSLCLCAQLPRSALSYPNASLHSTQYVHDAQLLGQRHLSAPRVAALSTHSAPRSFPEAAAVRSWAHRKAGGGSCCALCTRLVNTLDGLCWPLRVWAKCCWAWPSRDIAANEVMPEQKVSLDANVDDGAPAARLWQ